MVCVNGSQALYLNHGWLKYISGMSFSPANKNLVIMLFIFIHLSPNKISPSNVILLKEVLLPNWFNNLEASCLLMKLDFLLPHTAHLNNSMIFQFLIFETLGFYSLYSLCTLDNMITPSFNFNGYYTLDFRLCLSFCLCISSISIFLPCSNNVSRLTSPS